MLYLLIKNTTVGGTCTCTMFLRSTLNLITWTSSGNKCWFEKLGSLSNGFKIQKQIKMTFGLSYHKVSKSQGFQKSGFLCTSKVQLWKMIR